MEEGGGRRWI